MKKLSFLLFILITFLASGFGALMFSFKANNFRVIEANKLESDSTNSKEGLIKLIQSDFLAPTDEKKMKIAQLYLVSGEYKRAEQYLKKVKSNSGYTKYAQAALEENNVMIADVYMAKLTDTEAAKELNIFKSFIKGNFDVTRDLPTSPKTDALRILQAVNTKNFSHLPETTLGSALKTATKGKSGAAALLATGQVMHDRGQIKFAEYITSELLTDHPDLKEVHILRSEVMLAQNKPLEALESLELAMALDPADQKLYEKAINIAIVTNDSGKIDLFQQRLAYLKKITK